MDGSKAVVTTLWRDYPVTYDSTLYFLRVLAVVLDSKKGDVASGHILEFASPARIAPEDGPHLVEQWLSGTLDERPILVLERSATHAFERGFLYRPGTPPVALTVEARACAVGLGKSMATMMCDVIGWEVDSYVCMGWAMDGSDERCWARYSERLACWEPAEGGPGGGSPHTPSGPGSPGGPAGGDPGYSEPPVEKVPVLGPTETKKSLEEMMQQTCGITDSQDQADNYERNLANFLFGGMQHGKVARFLAQNGANKDGLDGYMTLNRDYDGNLLDDYISVVMEAKFTSTSPMDSEDRYDQAIRHIDFLASEHDRYRRDYPAVYYYGTGPVYVIVSQNTMPDNPGHPDPDRRYDKDWWIGKRDSGTGIDYHQDIIRHATDRGVAVLHVKIANQKLVGGVNYRNVVFRSFNDMPILHSELAGWLKTATDVLPEGVTLETLWPMRWDCNAHRTQFVGDLEKMTI